MKNYLFIALLFWSVGLLAQNHAYPIPPKTSELMFYIQRNHNSNTIVYEANFKENGDLNEKDPLVVSWIRYDEEGQRMELRAIEKWYAYGLKSKKLKHEQNAFEIELVAYKDRSIYLKQIAKNKAEVKMEIDNKTSILDHIYIQADNSGLWPDVKYIELFGKEKENDESVYEKIINE